MYLIRLDHITYEKKGGGLFSLGEAWRELHGVACCSIVRDVDGVVVMRRGMGHTELRRRDGVFRTRWQERSHRIALADAAWAAWSARRAAA